MVNFLYLCELCRQYVDAERKRQCDKELRVESNRLQHVQQNLKRIEISKYELIKFHINTTILILVLTYEAFSS